MESELSDVLLLYENDIYNHNHSVYWKQDKTHFNDVSLNGSFSY